VLALFSRSSLLEKTGQATKTRCLRPATRTSAEIEVSRRLLRCLKAIATGHKTQPCNQREVAVLQAARMPEPPHKEAAVDSEMAAVLVSRSGSVLQCLTRPIHASRETSNGTVNKTHATSNRIDDTLPRPKYKGSRTSPEEAISLGPVADRRPYFGNDHALFTRGLQPYAVLVASIWLDSG
jgi:hypothetical protein